MKQLSPNTKELQLERPTDALNSRQKDEVCPPFFTVFTPTYNRAHTLHRVFESLRAQTYRDFEWIIVDDGSTDDTNQLVAQWQKEVNFPIHYFWQENRGKHIAFNRGVTESHGELFVSADSDDAFVPEALDCFKGVWDAIPEANRRLFFGVGCLCKDQDGHVVGNIFPKDTFDSNSVDLRFRHKIAGEKWSAMRRELLQAHPFPEWPNCKFVPESLIWDSVTKRYPMRFVNKALRVYFTTPGENNLSALTSASLEPRFRYYQWSIGEHWPYFAVNPIAYFRISINYVRYGCLIGQGLAQQLSHLGNLSIVFCWLLALIPGFLLSVRDRHRLNNV